MDRSPTSLPAQPSDAPPAAGKPARRSLGTWLALAFSLLSVFLTVLMVELVDVAATGQIETSIGQ
jgi:hypothetical protein